MSHASYIKSHAGDIKYNMLLPRECQRERLCLPHVETDIAGPLNPTQYAINPKPYTLVMNLN